MRMLLGPVIMAVIGAALMAWALVSYPAPSDHPGQHDPRPSDRCVLRMPRTGVCLETRP